MYAEYHKMMVKAYKEGKQYGHDLLRRVADGDLGVNQFVDMVEKE